MTMISWQGCYIPVVHTLMSIVVQIVLEAIEKSMSWLVQMHRDGTRGVRAS
jgi:hypothetical protein